MQYIIVFGIVLAMFLVWAVSVQRSFLALEENTKSAMLQVGLQLSSKWDALKLLLDVSNEFALYGCAAVTDNIKGRHAVTKDSSPVDVIKQELLISQLLDKLISQAEGCPGLKEDLYYLKALDAVNQYENMVHTSKLIYNESVTKLNRAVSMFPASIITVLLGFSKRSYLEVKENR